MRWNHENDFKRSYESCFFRQVNKEKQNILVVNLIRFFSLSEQATEKAL